MGIRLGTNKHSCSTRCSGLRDDPSGHRSVKLPTGLGERPSFDFSSNNAIESTTPMHQALLSGYRCQPMLKCHRAGRYVLLVGQQLLEENAMHFGQCLLAGALVASVVGFTRPRHKRLDCLYLLWRYVTKADLRSCDGARSRLTMQCGCGALSRGAPCSSLRFELGINRGLNAVDFLRTWASKTRRYRCSKRRHADRQ